LKKKKEKKKKKKKKKKRFSNTVGGSKTPNDGLANIELNKEEEKRQN